MYPPILDSSALQPVILLFSFALFFGGLPSLLIYIFIEKSQESTREIIIYRDKPPTAKDWERY